MANNDASFGLKIFSLKLGISFFIETEQYERCAHLQKIIDFLKQNIGVNLAEKNQGNFPFFLTKN